MLDLQPPRHTSTLPTPVTRFARTAGMSFGVSTPIHTLSQRISVDETESEFPAHRADSLVEPAFRNWHCHGAPVLRRSRWPDSPARMNKISYSGYRFPPEIIQQAIWLYLRFTLSLRDVEDLLAERGVAVSYERVRRWVNHFGPMIAAELRRRRQKPHSTWHLDEVYLKIDGRMVYLWRAVDAEGEVLDVLVQSKRNKHAALKLMRKLLRKYAFVPERLVTDDLRSYSATVRDLGIECGHERGRWKNNRAENSHQPTRVRVQPRSLLPRTPPSTTPSTSNAISPQLKRTARFAPRRWTRGGRQS
jgi:putative transposase